VNSKVLSVFFSFVRKNREIIDHRIEKLVDQKLCTVVQELCCPGERDKSSGGCQEGELRRKEGKERLVSKQFFSVTGGDEEAADSQEAMLSSLHDYFQLQYDLVQLYSVWCEPSNPENEDKNHSAAVRLFLFFTVVNSDFYFIPRERKCGGGGKIYVFLTLLFFFHGR
jgi:hypothetical protein